MNKIRKELMVTEHKADLWVVLRTASLLHSTGHIFCISQRQRLSKIPILLDFCSLFFFLKCYI
ncbi:hypothetical protein N665_0008s0235 [Sinapis alba]|nr:hypothetical protein N665_0008s0235 [Sinapis alba]